MVKIQYACVCSKGPVRKTNQDNLVWERNYLPLEHDGLSAVISADKVVNDCLLFGVFDGMGGEPRGDAAAFIAAKSFACWQETESEEGLLDLCRRINREICGFAEENALRSCGSTAALLMMGEKKVIGCNLGDSRLLLWRAEKLTQLSEDHVLPTFSSVKPPLLQYLGIPETEMILEPTLFQMDYQSDDVYVICSDGLTDMLTMAQMIDILRLKTSIDEKARMLKDRAILAGGRDNITIIIIKVNT